MIAIFHLRFSTPQGQVPVSGDARIVESQTDEVRYGIKSGVIGHEARRFLRKFIIFEKNIRKRF
jgi:hypothetical protein